MGQERGLCVAVEAGRRKDVTRRYAKMFHRRKREVDWGWWEETMAEEAVGMAISTCRTRHPR